MALVTKETKGITGTIGFPVFVYSLVIIPKNKLTSKEFEEKLTALMDRRDCFRSKFNSGHTCFFSKNNDIELLNKEDLFFSNYWRMNI